MRVYKEAAVTEVEVAVAFDPGGVAGFSEEVVVGVCVCTNTEPLVRDKA